MSASVEDTLKLLGEGKLEDIQVHLLRFPSAIRELKDEGVSTLHLALSQWSCPVALVQILLEYGADPNFYCKRFSSSTPLYAALHCRDRVGIIRALVEGGARVKRPKGSCRSVLTEAIVKNVEIEVIKLLLSAGANLLKQGISGVSPLFQALRFSNVGTFNSLLDLQDIDISSVMNLFKGSLLHSYLRMDRCTSVFVKFLIDRGIRVDSVDIFKNTPLHVAVGNPTCHPDVVDVLLRKGSLVNVLNRDWESPLDIAIRNNCNPDIIQLLLKYCLLQNPGFNVEDSALGHELKEMHSRYANDCQHELQRMNSENVGDGRTLFEFLRAYSGNQMIRTKEDGFDVDILLQIISANLYPLYSNVISSKLGRSLLRDKLGKCKVFTVVEVSSDVRCVTKKVSLNDYCVHILANFLDENDLLNTIFAFCN